MQPMIGILAAYLHGQFNAAVVRGVQRALRAVNGRTVYVQCNPAELVSGGLGLEAVDGWIAISRVEGIDRLAAQRPTVAVCGALDGSVCLNIMPDNQHGTRAAVEHLLGHGHTRIAHITLSSNVDFRERHAVYAAVLRAHGLEPDPALLVETTGYTHEEARDAMAQLLARGVAPTAVFAANDIMALGVYAACAAAGLRVPQDIAVVGFDDISEAVESTPPLTTVRMDGEQLGAMAAERVLALLSGTGPATGLVRLPTELVVRASCGGPRDHTPAAASQQPGAPLAGYYRTVLETETFVMRKLLDAGDVTLDRLDWLAPTAVQHAVLALWDGADSTGGPQLRVRGSYARRGTPLAPALLPAGAFPWLARYPADAQAEIRHIKVAPIISASREWGVLAYAAPLGEPDYDGSMVWTAMIGLALEREQLLEALAANQATLESAYTRERALAETVRDLGCPLIPLLPGVLLVPLVGAIDSARATQIMERVLTGVGREHASQVLIDITGVPIVDTEIAAALIQTAQAVRMLGAAVTLVGVRPEIAQSIVQLGIDLGMLATRPTLAAALAQLQRTQQPT